MNNSTIKQVYEPLYISLFLKKKLNKYEHIFYIHGSKYLINQWAEYFSDIVNIKKVKKEGTINLINMKGTKDDLVNRLLYVNNMIKLEYKNKMTKNEEKLFQKNKIFDNDKYNGKTIEELFYEN